MGSPRTFDIYLKPGEGEYALMWSYFDDDNPDHWAPVTPSSPALLLKRKDEVNWYGTRGISDIEIIYPPDPKVFQEESTGKKDKKKAKAKKDMQARSVDKYTIRATIGDQVVDVDPKGEGANPPE